MIRLVSPENELDFDDVLIVPQRSECKSRDNVILERQFTSKHSGDVFTSVPIIASNMFATGTFKMAQTLSKHKMMTAMHKFHEYRKIRDFIKESDVNQELLFFTIGQSDNDFHKLVDFKTEGINAERIHSKDVFINIDVANGYRASFVKFVQKVRANFENAIIMAGNVCTPDMTAELILAGADIIKIGIGPGSVCETRKVTGVGYPQLSAISNCANAAHNLRGFICADGGCKDVGDICKAFCAGADFVMLGGMLAGTDECDGDWTYKGRKIYEYPKADPDGNIWFTEGTNIAFTQGFETVYVCTHDPQKHGQVIEEGKKKSLKFYGMSSREAMEKHGGSEKEYRASEGKCIEVPYKGPVDDTMKEILGGLRSCGTYIGAMQIKHFPKHANFVRIK